LTVGINNRGTEDSDASAAGNIWVDFIPRNFQFGADHNFLRSSFPVFYSLFALFRDVVEVVAFLGSAPPGCTVRKLVCANSATHDAVALM
jgi:hypothetical protein